MSNPTTPGVDRISVLLQPYLLAPLAAGMAEQLSLYLELLLRWNARTNLTAIRSPEEIVRRHFGESLFAAQHLPAGLATLLDFGSGAGFPGLPIQLCHPELKVTLAESQGKKAAFLREAVRTLHLPTTGLHLPTTSLHLPTTSLHLPTTSLHLPTTGLHLPTTVYAGRVEDMPPSAMFSAATLRAVDDMASAIASAAQRVEMDGWLLILTSNGTSEAEAEAIRIREQGLRWRPAIPMPDSDQRVLLIGQKNPVANG